MTTAKKRLVAQKYRLGFPAQKDLTPAVNRALGQQFANADEMFETLFTDANQLATRIIDGRLGDVSGPAGAAADDVVLYDGVTGKIIKDSGVPLASVALLPVNLSTQVTGTLQAAQEPAHTGDVTNGAGSLALAIGAGKVTNAQLAGAIAASKLVGTDLVVTESQVTNLTTDLAAKASVAHHTAHETGGSDALAALSAAILTSGTLPDARFPATLPATAGVNLTNLNATNLASGTVPDARFPATLPATSGVNLTTLNAANLASGTVADARLSTNVVVRTEGTWTPVDASGAGLALTVTWAKYKQHGNIVFGLLAVQYPTTSNTASAKIGGFPPNAPTIEQFTFVVAFTDAALPIVGLGSLALGGFPLYNSSTYAAITNAQLSGKVVRGSFFYFTT